MLDQGGTEGLEEFSLNFVYQPLRAEAGTIEGIFVHAVDVTEQVRSRKRVEALVGHLPPSSPFTIAHAPTAITALDSKERCANRIERPVLVGFRPPLDGRRNNGHKRGKRPTSSVPSSV